MSASILNSLASPITTPPFMATDLDEDYTPDAAPGELNPDSANYNPGLLNQVSDAGNPEAGPLTGASGNGYGWMPQSGSGGPSDEPDEPGPLLESPSGPTPSEIASAPMKPGLQGNDASPPEPAASPASNEALKAEAKPPGLLDNPAKKSADYNSVANVGADEMGAPAPEATGRRVMSVNDVQNGGTGAQAAAPQDLTTIPTPATDALIKHRLDRLKEIEDHPITVKRQILGMLAAAMPLIGPAIGGAVLHPGGMQSAREDAALKAASDAELADLQKRSYAQNIQSEIENRQQQREESAQKLADARENQGYVREDRRQKQAEGPNDITGSYENLVTPAQSLPPTYTPPMLTSPEAPPNFVGPQQPPQLPLAGANKPIPLPAVQSTPESKLPGYNIVPPGPQDQAAGLTRVRPTPQEVARQKKVADQANWLPTPPAIKALYQNAPDTMPAAAIDSMQRSIDSGNQAEMNRIMREQLSVESIQARKDNAALMAAAVAGNRDNKADTALKTAAVKTYAPALDSAERFNVMAKNQEDALKNNDQQAMLSLLANHLGMTMGLQKGARLTKDIIKEAVASRPWLQGMASKFDKDGYLTGVTLTPQQMQQMVSLGRERFSEDLTKARSEASYVGVPDDGPRRMPNKATINYYNSLNGGDSGKARSAMEADGWSVQPGKMVRMKAPNGAVQSVPEDQVEHYKSLGASVVKN
jgi:hypothetical protein